MASENNEGFFRRNRRKITVGSGAFLAAGAGVAVAAIVLTTTVGGSLSVAQNDQTAADEITAVSVAGESDLACTVEGFTPDSFTVNATADKTTVNGEVTEDSAGACYLAVTVENTGDVQLKVDRARLLAGSAAGWELKKINPAPAQSYISPGDSVTVKLALNAGFDATNGDLVGELESVVTKS